MFPPRAILASVDFSEPSRVALTCAARLAKQCRAHLHVLHAEDPLLASAAMDRLLDNANVVVMEGTSFRGQRRKKAVA